MRRALCALIAALALPASAHAAADHLSVRSGRLRDAQGREVVLHGVNVVYKLAPYLPDFSRADARRLRGWGMNAIRLGVSWRALEPARGAVDQDYIARVRKLVGLAGAVKTARCAYSPAPTPSASPATAPVGRIATAASPCAGRWRAAPTR